MADKLTSEEFTLVRDALEMSATDLFHAIEKQCAVSLEAFQALERLENNNASEAQIDDNHHATMHISDVYKLLLQIFKVRFPGAFDDLFPNGY